MPLRVPSLDDRSYEDLVEELVARIPAHTPEWTNVRKGDPGDTINRCTAWLIDTMLYRANLIPERQRLVQDTHDIVAACKERTRRAGADKASHSRNQNRHERGLAVAVAERRVLNCAGAK